MIATSLGPISTPELDVTTSEFSLGAPGGARVYSPTGTELILDAAPLDGIHFNFDSGGYVSFCDGAENEVANINSKGEGNFNGGLSTTDISTEVVFSANDLAINAGQGDGIHLNRDSGEYVEFCDGNGGRTGVVSDAGDVTMKGAIVSVGPPAAVDPVIGSNGNTLMYFDPNGTSGNGSGNLRITGTGGAADPAFNLQLQRNDGSNFHTYMRAEINPATELPRVHFPENVDTDGTLTADDAQFQTCEVNGSSVRTEENTPDALPLTGGTLTGPLVLDGDPTAALEAATKQYVDNHGGGGGGMVYPPAGIPNSTGSAWGSSISPSSIAYLTAANIFGPTQTTQNGGFVAKGWVGSLSVANSATTIGTGNSGANPNITFINSTATANNRAWSVAVFPDSGSGDSLSFACLDDAGNATYWMAVWRNGTAATQLTIRPPVTLNGQLTVDTITSDPSSTLFLSSPNIVALGRGSTALMYAGYFGGTGSDQVNNILAAVPLFVSRDPLNNLEVASKQYVDNSGPKVIQVADEATAISDSSANPNNIYFWV